MAYPTHAAFKLLTPAPESGSLNLDITNNWKIHDSLQQKEKAVCFNMWAAWTPTALPGKKSGHAKNLKKKKNPLNIYEDIINELLSTAGNNGHLN